MVVRSVEAYDQGVILRDDRVTDRYTVASGANYITAVKAVLDGAGINLQNLEANDKTLPAALDWEPGTSKLEIVNALLSAINYRPLWFNEDGHAIAQGYVSPSVAPTEYTYRNDMDSVLFPDVEETLELFDVPNKWVMVVSEPDRAVITSTYTNTAASSPTSTVSRGRTIVDFREDNEAADQTTLDAKVARIAFEASQVYGTVDFETAIMPMHSFADVIELEYTDMGIDYKFAEHMWDFELRAGAPMNHSIRRVVTV